MAESRILNGPACQARLPPNECFSWILFQKMKEEANSDEVALIDRQPGVILTRKQLFDLVYNITMNLAKKGWQRGDMITIVSHNNYKAITVLLASILLGARVNVIDKTRTPEEVLPLLKKIKPKVIFYNTAMEETKILMNRLRTVLEEKPGEDLPKPQFIDLHDTVYWEDFIVKDECEGCHHFKPPVRVKMTDIAMVIPTAGTSTDQSRLAMISQRAIRAKMNYMGNTGLFGFIQNEPTLIEMPIAQMFTLCIIFASVLYKTKMLISIHRDLRIMFDLIQTYKVKSLYLFSPLLGHYLLDEDFDEQKIRDAHNLSSVVDIVAVGWPVYKKIEERIREKMPSVSSIRQAYDTTKACGPVAILPKSIQKLKSVGKIMEGHQAKICDIGNDTILGPNEPGKLLIKGDCVMQGYLDRGTTRDFVIDEQGFLSTGDVAYYDEDGYIYIVDRLLDIHKYFGVRVFPREVEDILNNNPSIRTAVVLSVPKPNTNARERVLMAFVSFEKDEVYPADKIIKYVEGKVSDKAKRLQGGVRFLDTFPRTLNGRIARNKLKKQHDLKYC